MKNIVVIFAIVVTVSVPLYPQVQLSGEASAYGLKSDRAQSPRVINKGNPTLGWRFDLFLDGKITDNVHALVNTRAFEDETINFDYVAIRITDIAESGVNFQIGKFDMPFGNLAERRFPEKNFLFGLPLIYEYRTSLPNQVVTRLELLNNRGKGVGIRLIDLGIYDIGAMVFGDVGKFHYAVAVANGTISSTSTRQMNTNSDFNKIVRLTYTPIMGLTFGAAGAMGAYLAEGGKPLPREETSLHYQQTIGEFDVEFSRGRFLFNGEAVYSQWTVPLENEDSKLSLLGYYAEAKYTWVPRFYTAARVSGLRFSQLDLEDISRRWDYDMLEVEAGIGYYLDRNTLVKVVRRETRTLGTTDPHDNLTVLQLAVAF